jgi:hypothetical protein
VGALTVGGRGVVQASHVHELDRLKTKCLRFIIDNYDSCRPEKVCVCA